MEFSRIYDYADMIRTTNPGSTIVARTSKEIEPSKEIFAGIYICLYALKTCWLEGCRRVIGFDGAFLKGVCKGELLSCISKDGNNQRYHVAWAVKGLVQAVYELMPNAEHRMCVKHIWSNWKRTWGGEERRKKFWDCARASFEAFLKVKLDELPELSGNKIIKDLLRYPKQSWHKPIITMLEEIRVKVTERMTNMREFATKWISDISHMALGYTEEQSIRATKHEYKWNGDTEFEIQDGIYKHIVDFVKKECTCRMWQLKGIPCSHTFCAIFLKKYDTTDYVEHWYKDKTYFKAFSCCIQPMANMEMWTSTQNPKVEPPVITKMPGRPKKHKIKAQDEPIKKFGKRSRKITPMTCSYCKTTGHNKKGCAILKEQSSSAGVGSSIANAQATTAASRCHSSTTTDAGSWHGRDNLSLSDVLRMEIYSTSSHMDFSMAKDGILLIRYTAAVVQIPQYLTGIWD
uniref:Uncharacterized protein LOC104229706 n=1 Tax=Nicotiana sylvestris TaxID=4096 RepID=A0A1U7WL49_NICSY|nr:PREDICTED: uncharacterized protein LOC104229706 [Nicotiana sylvestris]